SRRTGHSNSALFEFLAPGALARIGTGADQHFDPPVLPKLGVTKCAGLDLGVGYSGFDQCVMHGPNAAIAQLLVMRIAAAGIHAAVETQLQRWVFLEVGRDLRWVAALGCQD